MVRGCDQHPQRPAVPPSGADTGSHGLNSNLPARQNRDRGTFLQPEYHYLIHIALAVVLSMLIGAEREFHQKSAGLRTHTLVGLGSALFMVISKYGFNDISAEPGYSMDGSRVAAQIVSGIGFLGAGLIFVRRDTVRGLTTAASIWLVAAVGMAAGAGMFIIAPGVVAAYLIVTTCITPLSRRIPHSKTSRQALMIRYLDGQGVLRHIIMTIAEHGLKVSDLQMRTQLFDESHPEPGTRHQDIILKLTGSPHAVENSVVALNLVQGVTRISVTDIDDPAAKRDVGPASIYRVLAGHDQHITVATVLNNESKTWDSLGGLVKP